MTTIRRMTSKDGPETKMVSVLKSGRVCLRLSDGSDVTFASVRPGMALLVRAVAVIWGNTTARGIIGVCEG